MLSMTTSSNMNKLFFVAVAVLVIISVYLTYNRAFVIRDFEIIGVDETEDVNMDTNNSATTITEIDSSTLEIIQ